MGGCVTIDEILRQLAHGATLEGPHWTEPVKVLAVKARGMPDRLEREETLGLQIVHCMHHFGHLKPHSGTVAATTENLAQ